MIARVLISPQAQLRIEEIKKILAQNSIPSFKHPDLLYFDSDSKLGIEQARQIKEHFSIKPNTLKGKVAVIEEGANLTLDAQNAMLKLMEELPQEGLLIIGASTDARFLPTVLSRCHVIRLKGEEANLEKVKEIELLLSATIEERFEYIEKLKEKEEFLFALTSYFHKKLPKNKEFTKELLKAEEYAKQNVNIRAILEYLMLNLPK